MKEKCS